jgi:hypothetical protein
VEQNTNLSKALVGTMEFLDDLNDVFIEADRQAGITGVAVEELADGFDDMSGVVVSSLEKVADASQATMEALSESMKKGADSFKKYNDDMLKSGKAFIEGLILQQISLQTWGDNLGFIAQYVSAGFVQELADMGVAGAELVADLASDLDLLARAEEAWQARNAASFSAASISVNAAKAAIQSDIRSMTVDMDEVLAYARNLPAQIAAITATMPPITPPSAAPSGGVTLPPLLEFSTGGMIPGSRTTPVPIIAHGGEYVLSADVVDAIRRGGPSRDIDPLSASNVQSGPAVIIENYTAIERSDDEMLIGMLEFAVRGGRL